MDIDELKGILASNLKCAAPLGTFSDLDGLSLPNDYLEFLRFANGAFGFLGETYVEFWSIREIADANAELEIGAFLPGFLAFGGDGANELFVFDRRTSQGAGVYQVPMIGMEPDALRICADTFTAFVLFLMKKS